MGLKIRSVSSSLNGGRRQLYIGLYTGLDLLVGILIRLNYTTQTTAWLLQIGALIFAGSLYAMTLGAPRWLGAITPIGGMLMIAGWLWLAVSTFRLGHTA